jgi:hypothetical protein
VRAQVEAAPPPDPAKVDRRFCHISESLDPYEHFDDEYWLLQNPLVPHRSTSSARYPGVSTAPCPPDFDPTIWSSIYPF